MINVKTKLCLVIGDPITHSLSPTMRNYAYEKLGLQGKFVFCAAQVRNNHIADAIKGIRALGMTGCSVTLPHKQAVMPFLDQIDPLAEKISAVNTILNMDGQLCGFNTDYYGFLTPLKKQTSLLGAKVVILGAGGAARAAILAMKDSGAKVTIMNRTADKAAQLAKEFAVEHADWQAVDLVNKAGVLINCTSAELLCGSDDSGLPCASIRPGQIVFDAVYKPGGTEFVKIAKNAGANVIDGHELLAAQGAEQFRMYTGKEVSFEIMLEALRNNAH